MPDYMTNWARQMVNNVKRQYGYGISRRDNENQTDENGNSTENGDGTDGTNGAGNVAPTTNSMNTAGTVQSQNDPKKNKKLAELKMSEPMKDLLNFELVLPGVYPGIKTNQFIWIPVKNEFYDEMYQDIMEQIGPSKFNRYADFEKGRFYISKKTWEYDIENGVKTSLVVNPFPSMYSEYMKMQLEAERALDQAVIDASGGGGGNGGTSAGSGLGSNAIEVANALAAKYSFGYGCSTYECLKSSGSGECWAWSDALWTELKAIGMTVRIIQYDSGVTGNHRSVQYKDQTGNWVDFPYRQTNLPWGTRSTTSKGGCFVYRNENGEGGG